MGSIWQILFVLGVIIMALGVNGGPPYCGRIAWILWAIAAVIWFAVGYSGAGLGSTHCARLIC